MTITAPINVEPQHDDIEILDDDIDVIERPAVVVDVASEEHEPLMPFLALGIVSFVAILVVSILLAF